MKKGAPAFRAECPMGYILHNCAFNVCAPTLEEVVERMVTHVQYKHSDHYTSGKIGVITILEHIWANF